MRFVTLRLVTIQYDSPIFFKSDIYAFLLKLKKGEDKPSIQDFVVICLFDAIQWDIIINIFQLKYQRWNIKDLVCQLLNSFWWDKNHFNWMRSDEQQQKKEKRARRFFVKFLELMELYILRNITMLQIDWELIEIITRRHTPMKPLLIFIYKHVAFKTYGSPYRQYNIRFRILSLQPGVHEHNHNNITIKYKKFP